MIVKFSCSGNRYSAGGGPEGSSKIKIFKGSCEELSKNFENSDSARFCVTIYKYPGGIDKDLGRIVQRSWLRL